MARRRWLFVGLLWAALLATACGSDEPSAPGSPVAAASAAPPDPTAARTASPAPTLTTTPMATPVPTAPVTVTRTATPVQTVPAVRTPTGTATAPFPPATVMPGDIDFMMGGRFESPRPGDTVRSPIAIRGFANAFEGAVLVVLRDRAGARVGQVPATGAMGSFGAFNVTLTAPLDPARSPYTLEMTVQSPRDGAVAVIAQVPVVAGTPAGTGREQLSGGPLPGTIRLSQPRVRAVSAGGFEVEFVSSSPCQGAVYFPLELAGRTIGTTRATDEQRLATYHLVRVDARVLANLERGRRYRWYITCENPATTPTSPEVRVSLPFEQAIP